MAKNSRLQKDTPTQIIDKLNTLALELLDSILEKRRKNSPIDLEDVKVPLLAIKEIKDLCKINQKIEDSSFGKFFKEGTTEETAEDFIEESLDMKELEGIEKDIEKEIYDDRIRRNKGKIEFE